MKTTSPNGALTVATGGGLTTEQAEQRLAAYGPNTVATAPKRRFGTRIRHQLTDPLVLLLLGALVVTVAVGDAADSIVIALVVVVNTAIGVSQEVRADRAIAELDQMAAPIARVVRDGVDVVIPAAELVRDDLVSLEAGDIVPADLRLLEARRVRFGEAALTGESVPVDRTVGEEVFAGTVLVAGRASGVVVRTGAASALGRIAALVLAATPGPTPLQRRLAGLSRMLGVTVVVLSAAVFGLGLATGAPVLQMAITAVSLVVAAVPESLPAVVTLALALGARRMTAEQAIPRRLSAVETLGSVTVVACDKTGTLTEGQMAVRQVALPGGARYTIDGTGYAPTGQVRPPPDEALRELARAGLLCNDAALSPPAGEQTAWQAIGDPLEAALVAFAGRCQLDPAAERAAWPRLGEQPFDQSIRRMTTLHRDPAGGFLLVSKGAPEAISALLGRSGEGGDGSSDVGGAGGESSGVAAQLAAAGMRVLAVASARVDQPVPPEEIGQLGTGWPRMRLLGFVGVADPLRQDAAGVARAFERAGVRLILVTGDHPETAAAIGRELELWRSDDDLVTEVAGELDPARADRARIFARTQPEHKLDIVAALRADGHVVAMTGDGVNDAPALRGADIGVAMGSGTEVARQAADLVLINDNLRTLDVAVREGRRIYDNIRRFLHYGLSGGAAEILVMLIGPLLGLPLPLLPAQILWINLLTHGVPGVALGAEPAEPGVMERLPRSPQESVLGGGLLLAVARTGAVLSVTVLAAGVVSYHLARPWQSIIFVVLGLAQLGIAVAVRAPRGPGERGNMGLLAAVALSGVLQVAGVAVGPLRELLGTEPLSAVDLLACFVVAALPGLALRLGRWGAEPVHR